MSTRRQGGMGLVELMVWTVISMLVIGIIGIIYVNGKTLTRVNDTVSRMQENGRYAMYLIERDLRMAAYRGCNGASVTPNNLLNSAAYAYQYANGVAGYAGASGGTWSPALDASISALSPAPLDGSDVVTIRLIDGPGIPLIAKQTASTDDLTVDAGSPLGAGDVLLVADCSASTIFNATAVDSGAGTISHDTSNAVVPGNTSGDLGHAYGTDASVYRLVTRTYFVAPSTRRPGINSLWSNSTPAYDGQPQPEEVVEGVEGLALLFGEDLDGQRAANRYVTADAVGNWANVVSLRAQVLLGTTRDNVASSPQPYTFDGNTTTPSDHRVRTTMASVITVRNRVP